MATSASKRRTPRSESLVELEKQVLAALTDMKAVNVKLLDVRSLTDVADTMIIASGTSDRHVRAIAENVVTESKKHGYRPRGVEGGGENEWVLVDLQDVLVHVMLPRVREFYALEQLWEAPAEQRKARGKASGKTSGKTSGKAKSKTSSASERQRTAGPAARRPKPTRRSARR